ncbi:hypothetical protein MettiDRAFT_2781 [Methanolobus tindarius DSM 2278]|uniref:Uncharacterized protein n=1 Tax=Methanolobus tindarius DSM 2278 TaxID=1090322 RepID=W9DUH4_METTI|nr:hypothetical protein [Methanolobus tindarius]ETA69285.1 hypothetical protein MettiDRAFT_2781 [Methanolobus tindarius DSM 2278]
MMRIGEIKFGKYDILSYVSIVVTAICIVLYLLPNKIEGIEINKIDILLYLLVSLSTFLIANTKKNDLTCDKVTQISNEITVLKENTEKINRIADDVDLLKSGTPAVIKPINNQEDFYHLLNASVITSSTRVWVTHLDQWAPTSPKFSDKDRVNYFDSVLEHIQTHPAIDFKRIISIPTKDKLEWVEKLIMDTDAYQNLHLAYIRIDDIEDIFPFSVVSCQIIDENKMFILNPLLNRVPRNRGQFKECLYFENKNIVGIYSNYYEKLWDKITQKDSLHGCILKDGTGTDNFYKNKNWILSNIKEEEPREDSCNIASNNQSITNGVSS